MNTIFYIWQSAAAVFLLLRSSFAEPCIDSNIVENVFDSISALSLAAVVLCEGGDFTVTWSGSIQILQTVEIGENTKLKIAGVDEATIDGAGVNQLFRVNKLGSLILEAVTLTGGFYNNGGAIALDSESYLSLENCEFVSNNAAIAGGAIYMSESVTADIKTTNFTGNTIWHYDGDGVEYFFGGAIYVGSYCTINISDCEFNKNAVFGSRDLSTTSSSDSSANSNSFNSATRSSDLSTTNSHSHTNSPSASSLNSPAPTNVHTVAPVGLYISSTLLEYSGGYGGAIALRDSSQLSIINSSFISNAAYVGGAVSLIGKQSSCTIEKTSFHSNYAIKMGGAVDIGEQNEKLYVTASSFIDNKVTLDDHQGGGAVSIGSLTSAKIESSDFTGNSCNTNGGGISTVGDLELLDCTAENNYSGDSGGFLGSYANLNMTNTHVLYNQAVNYGGGMYISLTGGNYVTITSSTLEYNKALFDGEGGALHLYMYSGGGLEAHDSKFISNTAKNGGALSMTGTSGDISFYSCEFSSNSAISYGGAFYLHEGSRLNLSNSIISECDSDDRGGGVYVSTGTSFGAVNSVISNNIAITGGGIWSSGSVYLEDSYGLGNQAITFGGFIYTGYASATSVTNSKISENRAVNGAGIFIQDGTLTLDQVEFFGNEASQAGAGIFQFFAEISVNLSSATFSNNNAYCCYVEGSALDKSLPYSCSDVDFGSGTLQCCPSTQYINNGVCEVCDSEFRCNEVGLLITTIPLIAGYWREDIHKVTVLECPLTDACIGGIAENNSDDYCAEGYEGPYCAVCKPDYISFFGDVCLKCDQSSSIPIFILVAVASSIILTGIVLVLGSLLGLDNVQDAVSVLKDHYIISSTSSILSSIPFDKLRVPYVVFSILTQYITITGLSLPPLYAKFIKWINLINFNVNWFSMTSCSVRIGFYDDLLFSTLFPLCLLSLTACTYIFNLYRIRKLQLDPETTKNKIELTRAKHILVILVFCFLIYSTVSTIVFKTFACDTLNDSGDRWLRADYSVNCDASKHISYEIYASFMILLYPIGIPALFLCLLWKRHASIQNATERNVRSAFCDCSLSSTSFLWAQYRTNRWWWEVMECLRRLMQTGLLVFIMPESPGQAAMSVLFSVMSMIAFGAFQPLIDGFQIQSYWLGCFILFGTCFSALLLKGEYASEDDQSQTVIAILLIILNVLLVLAAVVQIITGYKLARGNINMRQNSLFGIRNLEVAPISKCATVQNGGMPQL